MDLLENDFKYVWHPFTQAKTAPEPLAIVKANGVWLIDENDVKYLDANSSWWTNIHGHCHPHITKQISAQLSVLDHSIFAGATHPKAVELARRICGMLPQMHKAFFSDNGSTAVEVAIKMAYQYWYNKGISKKRFLAFEGAYHGDTFGAMSVGQRGYFNEPFEHLFFEVDYLPFPNEDNIQSILDEAEKLVSAGDFAGFIFEPLVQGAAGMRIYKAEWLDAILEIVKKHEVVCIADEVMTGFYRTGTAFALNQLSHSPDIVCLSKGLTGGVLPLSLTLANKQIYDAFFDDKINKALLHGHSFTGNAIACAAACASLDLLEADETLKQISMISEKHDAICKVFNALPRIKSAQSLGTILSVEIEVEEGSSYFSQIRDKAYNFFLSEGILLRPLGNVIFLNPPYCISENELDLLYAKMSAFLKMEFD